MQISRRNFLGGTIGSAAVLSLQTVALCNSAPWRERELECGVLDLKSHCVLRESLYGYRAALGLGDNQILDIAGDARHRCRLLIIPGAGGLDHQTAQIVSDWLKRGTVVVLESGAAFLCPGEFAVDKAMLRRYFAVDIGPPANLWSASFVDRRFSARLGRSVNGENVVHRAVPYVNYTWPCESMVRDYSYVTPVSENCGEVIARVNGVPVALKRRTGNGALVFLGSPLGPALGAGDREAEVWLHSLTARSGRVNAP
jgi:hypothetical protein